MSTATVDAPIVTRAPLTADPLVASTDVKTLTTALAFVNSALPARPPLQVLLGVLVTATTEGVTVAAFDYDTSCSQTIEGVGTGQALVPGKLLLDVVKKLDAGQVTLEVNASVTRLTLRQAELEFHLPLLPLDDYPSLPDSSAGKRIATVTGADLVELGRVGVAAGRDDTVPVLTAIALESEDGFLRTAATDRYRLAVATTTTKTTLTEILNVPSAALALAVKHLGKASSITLRHNGGAVRTLSFDDGARRITTRLLDGEFPRYRSLIPTDTAVTVTISSPVLAKAIKQVSVVAARNAPVRVEIDNALVVSCGNDDDAGASKKVAATVTGLDEAQRTAYNPGYLLDGLLAVSAKGEVQLAYTQPLRPAILTEPADTGRAFLYLIMPVRLG